MIYYKGGLKKADYRDQRLSDKPHYFGSSKIGRVYPDTRSSKGDHFAEILSFRQFSKPVLAKQDGTFIEVIPDSRATNYWRDGVRPITSAIFQRIESLASLSGVNDTSSLSTNDHLQGLPESLTSGVEGSVRLRMISDYERCPQLRAAAIRIHGTSCSACGFNFAETFGQHGAGYIQVHHLDPLGDEPGERRVDAETDLAVLCANCHVMVHRYRDRTLSMAQLKVLLATPT